jgi:diguanylate cyclase (GGDEF)-like protein/PAS domain S-box-containing protein
MPWRNEVFQALVENSSDAIGLVTADGTVIYASPSTSRVLGYDAGELLGRNGLDLVHPEDLERTKTLLATLGQEPGGRVVTEVRVRHKSDGWRWVEAVGTNLLHAPSVGAIVVNYRDITERKRSEDALRDANERLTFWARELERRNRNLSLLSEMSTLLQASHNTDEAYRVIARFAGRLFADGSGAVYIVDPQRGLAEAIVSWGASAGEEPVFRPVECWALRLGRVHISESGDHAVLCGHLPLPTPASSLCAPLVAQGEALGVLHLRYGPDSSRMVESDRVLAVTVADQIALALANLKLRDSLRDQSIRDPLTGLYNRRYMEDSLERELRRAERHKTPVAVIAFDVDYFKNINDTFGHEAGDAFLAAFGEFLRARIRKEDIPCRYGGEEFVLILPGASLADASARAEQLREAARLLTVGYREGSLGPMTLSLGIAVFPDHGATRESLLRAADASLYRAKQNGRDRVEVPVTGRGIRRGGTRSL